MCFLCGLELLSASCGFDSRWEHSRRLQAMQKKRWMEFERIYSQRIPFVSFFIGRQPATEKAKLSRLAWLDVEGKKRWMEFERIYSQRIPFISFFIGRQSINGSHPHWWERQHDSLPGWDWDYCDSFSWHIDSLTDIRYNIPNDY